MFIRSFASNAKSPWNVAIKFDSEQTIHLLILFQNQIQNLNLTS